MDVVGHQRRVSVYQRYDIVAETRFDGRCDSLRCPFVASSGELGACLKIN